VLNSKYSSTILQLVTCDYLCLSDAADNVDRSFKKFMDTYDFNSANLFLIKQLGDQTCEGFVGVFFKNTHIMDASQREIVTENIPKILNLVNLRESALKD